MMIIVLLNEGVIGGYVCPNPECESPFTFRREIVRDEAYHMILCDCAACGQKFGVDVGKEPEMKDKFPN